MCDLLAHLNYSLQSVRKTREGGQHPDRDAQFQYIATMVTKFQRQRQPVISVDTRRRNSSGTSGTPGASWHPQGQPEQVRVHDFIDDELGKVAPYGVYDVTANIGWVSVGIDPRHGRVRRAKHPSLVARDGAAPMYARAKRLLITADCGGSNG